jgi:hypothetical protein
VCEWDHCSRAHCSTARWPPSAAALHVHLSHGQPCSRAHCSREIETTAADMTVRVPCGNRRLTADQKLVHVAASAKASSSSMAATIAACTSLGSVWMSMSFGSAGALISSPTPAGAGAAADWADPRPRARRVADMRGFVLPERDTTTEVHHHEHTRAPSALSRAVVLSYKCLWNPFTSLCEFSSKHRKQRASQCKYIQ